eukprot:NODE_22_length_42145_cov_1.310612.p35 type:complete len:106 gc:universal NODE_22_length_42145_cov_1.310612:39035-39352(+)
MILLTLYFADQLKIIIPKVLALKATAQGFTHIYVQCGRSRVNQYLTSMRKYENEWTWTPKYCKEANVIGLQFAQNGSEHFECTSKENRIVFCDILKIIDEEIDKY